MTGASIQRRRQSLDAWQVMNRDIAQPSHLQLRGGFLAFAPARPVVAAGVGVGQTGIDDAEFELRRKRNLVRVQRRGIEKERMRAISKTAYHLIHDADRRSNEVGFCAVTEHRDLEVRQSNTERGMY
jgi:hypothetical protein